MDLQFVGCWFQIQNGQAFPFEGPIYPSGWI
jgi:hypothetical protein